jgi:2,4-dienoyl-CoA reductase-like NADH-dependent reductase (Old Yellow Enzyme family)
MNPARLMRSLLFWPYQIYAWFVFLPVVAVLTLIFSTLTILFATLINPQFASRVFAATWARVVSFLTPMWVTIEGAENAQRAGFDGVEVHGANGYLLDQFLQDSTNRRTDAYGGSIAKRARLLLEVVDAAISVWGPGRVGVHLAPRGDAHDMGDSDPAATFGHVARELGNRGIAFIFTREHFNAPTLTPALKKAFDGGLIANEQLTKELATDLLQQGTADACAFGKLYIANPDLVARFRRDAPFNDLDTKTMYASGPGGYTDYPTL